MDIRKEIPGFPGYMAGNDGRIWTTKRKGGNDRGAGRLGPPREMRHSNQNGYRMVSLVVDGRVVSRMVHTLVLLAFAGCRPMGTEACHYPDPTRSNNRLDNLRWDSHRENIRDRNRGKTVGATKRCLRCHRNRRRVYFYGDKRASDGLQGECRSCHMAVSMATRDPEKKRLCNREFMRRTRASDRV